MKTADRIAIDARIRESRRLHDLKTRTEVRQLYAEYCAKTQALKVGEAVKTPRGVGILVKWLTPPAAMVDRYGKSRLYDIVVLVKEDGHASMELCESYDCSSFEEET